MNTWWAFRSSCAPTSCTAVGTLLDDNDHTQAKSPGGEPVVLDFRDGRWLSRPEKSTFPCIGSSGAEAMHATTQVLSLRPQPQGEFVGEMTVTVQSNECDQRGAVIRVPAMATRSGEVPPDVTVPDPATVPAIPDSPAAPTAVAVRAPSLIHPIDQQLTGVTRRVFAEKIASTCYLCYGSWQHDDLEETVTYDVIIRDGLWFDGTGSAPQTRTLGIRDGVVATVAGPSDGRWTRPVAPR